MSVLIEKRVHYYYQTMQFFRDLYARTLRVSDFNRLQADIIIILCNLERIFPPAFFSVMVKVFGYLSVGGMTQMSTKLKEHMWN